MRTLPPRVVCNLDRESAGRRVAARARIGGAGIAVLAVFWPALVLWMVWRVLTDKSVSVRSLRDDEDWAYQDYDPYAKARK